MLWILLGLTASNEYIVKGTTLTVSGTDPVTGSDTGKYVDMRTISEVIVLDGIPEIGAGAFSNSPVQKLTIPKSVLKFVPNSLRWCYSFSEFILDPLNPNYELDDGALYTKGKIYLMRIPSNKKTLTIPKTCTRIVDHAFNACWGLNTLIIPNSVTVLEVGFIYDCSFQHVVFESGSTIETLNSSTFAWCGIKSIFLPKSIKYINGGAFGQTGNLATFIFEKGSNLTELRDSAFAGSVIANCTIPPNVTKIGGYIFNGNNRLKTIHIPASVISISPQFLTGCNSVTSITVDEDNQNYTVQEPATLMNKEGTIMFYISSVTTFFKFPANLTSFSNTLIQSCSNLIQIEVENTSTLYKTDGVILYSFNMETAIACVGGAVNVKLNETCKKIGPSCFYRLKSLESVILNDVLVSVEGSAFYDVPKITRMDFPITFVSIGGGAFKSSGIQIVTFQGEGPRTIGDEAFQYSKLDQINLGKNLSYLGSFCFQDAPMTRYSLDINCSITTIFLYTFIRTKITRFVVPYKVKSINSLSFSRCSKLTEFIFPKNCSVERIESDVFSGSPISSLELPKTLKQLGNSIMNNNNALVSLTFEEGIQLERFGSGDWRECNSLVSVTIPSSITYFDASIFQGCMSLLEINVDPANTNYKSERGIVYTYNGERMVVCPAGVASAIVENYIIVIGANAFYKCQKLSKLTFADGCKLEEIEEVTFFSIDLF